MFEAEDFGEAFTPELRKQEERIAGPDGGQEVVVVTLSAAKGAMLGMAPFTCVPG